jgi:hypothetical protein
MALADPRHLTRESWERQRSSKVRDFMLMHDDGTWNLLRRLNTEPALHHVAHQVYYMNSMGAALANADTLARDHEDVSYRMSSRLHDMLGRPAQYLMEGFNTSRYPRHLDIIFADRQLPQTARRGGA